jgi:ATP-dependent helicase/nuclease subunit A
VRLNPHQTAIAHDSARHVLVAAGAGTGKTQCVVARLLYLLGEPVGGRRIPDAERLSLRDVAAVTFTNVAAADLQRKLREALRAAGRRDEAHQVDTARIGTIHAFCGRILREFALQLPRRPGLVLLEEAESVALAAESAREALQSALMNSDLPGLDALLSEFSVEDVLRFAARIAADSSRLVQIRQDDGLDDRERALLGLAERTLLLMRGRLDERSALDFDAMIALTRDLLRDNEAVRRVLQRRVRVLIVDEFQDVDPAQQEIAYLLGEPESARTETTRLLLVGDPKQSIFRFRRADVTVWTRVRRDFERHGFGAVHELAENFRSRRPILAFVDAVLGPELSAPVDPAAGRADYEVNYAPLIACEPNDSADACVEILTLPQGEDGKALAGDGARSIEVPAVAARVNELIRAGTSPGDIAILLSAWAPAEAYRRTLGTLGIASWTLRNEGYFERREVLDCVVALQAVLDPRDDLALFGFLRSPMVGLRDDTLLRIAREAKPPYWRQLDTVQTGEADLVAFGARVLHRFAGLRDRLPPDVLLEELLDQTGYLAHLRLLGDDGRQAEANVGKLVRMLRGWRDLTVRDVLRTVAEVREREEGSREGDAPLGARQDAVTITSIHSAKGLEWPVVVWADLSRGAPPATDKLCLARAGLRLRDPAIEAKDDARFAALKAAEGLEERAQRKRLWYVAATRAKERFIVAGVPLGPLTWHHRGGAAECLRRLGELDAAAVEYRDHLGVPFMATASRAVPLVVAEAVPTEPLPVLPAETLGVALEPLDVRGGRTRHSATELLTFSRCPRRHWFMYNAGIREPEIERGTADFIDAVTRGHIVHDVLEHLRQEDALDQLLEDAIGRWDPDAPPPDGAEGGRYRGHLREEVSLVAGHPDWRAVAEQPGARRELAFVHLLGEGRHVQGRIDLAAARDDGLVLVDVKTSQHLDAEQARQRAAGYAPQRDVYVGAAEALSGRQVAAFAFHFSRAAAHVAQPITPALRAAGQADVAGMLTAIEAGERSLTKHPRECLFCGYRKAAWCEGLRETGAANVRQAGKHGA